MYYRTFSLIYCYTSCRKGIDRMNLHHQYHSYEINHLISSGVNFPYYVLARGDIRINPFMNNRPEAYNEFQEQYGVAHLKRGIKSDTWHKWLRTTVLDCPDSAEKSADIGPCEVQSFLPSFSTDWPRISSALEKEVQEALSHLDIEQVMGGNEALLDRKYGPGRMRFYYNLLATWTTQHYGDDVSIGLQFVRTRKSEVDGTNKYLRAFDAFVSHELRHMLIDQMNPYTEPEIQKLVTQIVSHPAYRQYRSPAVADIEEQMNKVLDGVTVWGDKLTLEHVEIVPIFSGD